MIDNSVDRVNELYDRLRAWAYVLSRKCWERLQSATHEFYLRNMRSTMAAERGRRPPGHTSPPSSKASILITVDTWMELPLDTSLSFFDDYEIIDGSPVFILDASVRNFQNRRLPSTSSHKPQDSVLEKPVEIERNVKIPTWQRKLKSEKLNITCYTFSHDDQFVACGTTNGSVLVYDASRGSLFRTLAGSHFFAVADVAFARSDPFELISVDLDGFCVRWNCKSAPVTFTRKHCAPCWDDSNYVGKELAAPSLSNDGSYVAFPIYTYTEIHTAKNSRVATEHSGAPPQQLVPILYSILFIFETQALTNDLTRRVDPLYLLPVKISEPYIVVERFTDLVRFSRTSCRLFMTVYELGRSYLILWPNLETGTTESFRLNGTRGQFSNDDRFVVTWHSMLTSMDMTEDANVYIWDVQALEKEGEGISCGWQHPTSEAQPLMILGDPNRGVIHSCDFVRLGKRRGLVSCCVDDDVTLVVWCLTTQTPLHVLKTGISKEDISPVNLRAMSAATQSQALYRVHGLNSVATFRSGQWAGIYGSHHRRGIIWDVNQGVEVMRIQIPENKAEPQSGMDFIFSKTATKMLHVSQSRMLLWSPSILRRFNAEDQPMYVQKSGDAEIHKGECVCKFSNDSSTVGLMRINGQIMTLWKFSPLSAIYFDRRTVTEEVQVRGDQSAAMDFLQIADAKHRFCQFAVSPTGMQIVTCMGDMAVLLWHIDNARACRHIATLSSNSCPALDVCFSRNMVVACQDQGVLLWIHIDEQKHIHREATGARRSCRFTANGKTAVLMKTPHHVVVWDLITRKCVRSLNYTIPILSTSMQAFNPQLAPQADFCLVGFDAAQRPLLFEEATTFEDTGIDQILCSETFGISDDGQWAILSGRINDETDDLHFEEQPLPDFAADVNQPRFPEICFFEPRPDEPLGRHDDGPPKERRKQTWRIIHLAGQYQSKQIRLPCEILANKLVTLSPDGTRCAAMNTNHELVVWGTHLTYKSILQQRYDLMNGNENEECDKPDFVIERLFDCGSSLVNHPYEGGRTIVMQCIVERRFKMLKNIFDWAIASGNKLSFQGQIRSSRENESVYDENVNNVIDLAINSRSPDMVYVLLQAMTDEATSVSSMAQILEHSIVKLSYHYPELVLHFFKNPKLMRSQGKVRISEPYLQKRNDYLRVITDQRIVTSQHYIQRVWEQDQEKVGQSAFDRPHNNSTILAVSKVIPYPNIAKIGREGILQPLLFRRVQHLIFGSDLVRGVIAYKFETYARTLLLEDLYHYLVLLVFFTGSCIFAGYKRSFGVTAGTVFTLFLVAVVGFGNLVRFTRQIITLWSEQQYSGLTYYLYDYMRWLEFISYITVVFFLPIAVAALDGKSEVVRSIMSVASVSLWVKLLYYAQAFRATGPMVVMIREIVKDIRWFLFLLVALLLGFGVAFFVLLSTLGNEFRSKHDAKETSQMDADTVGGNTPSTERGFPERKQDPFYYFKTPFSSLVSVFQMMLSDISDILESIYNSTGIANGTKVVAYLLVVFFLATVAIILLNLLIAIMGDSFDRVKNHEKTLFLQRRAEVIQDVEMGLPKRRKAEINDEIQRYLHILTPEFQSLAETDWEGRLVDIQRRMREELREARAEGSGDVIALKEHLLQIKKELQALKAVLPLQELSELSTAAADLQRNLAALQTRSQT